MSTKPHALPAARVEYLPVIVAVGVYVLVMLRTAWISDDAYITFRTVDNFINGYGLTWNVAERVQAYTHPLWMLILSAPYALTHEINFTVILLSVVLSCATVLLFVGRGAVDAKTALIGVVALAFSKAYTDYSTSGLENPLTHILLLAFVLVYLGDVERPRRMLWLALLAALLMLSRLDALLLVAPAVAVELYRQRSWKAVGWLAVGLMPLVLWELFSLLYYGSPIPNAAAAKLNHDIPKIELVLRGLRYVLVTLKYDPLTLLLLFAGLVTPFFLRVRRHMPLAIGGILYVLYVIGIGGDFMLGRFLSAPFLLAVILLARQQMPGRVGLALLALVVLVGYAPKHSPLRTGEDYESITMGIDEDGFCDERGFFFHGTGLLIVTQGKQLPAHRWARFGKEVRAEGEELVIARSIGMVGYFAGPDTYVMDLYALADPLLAHLKPPVVEHWRSGHLERIVPAGYFETVRSGQNHIANEHLAAYYDKLTLITRGRLFDPQRLLAILKLNLGGYNDLLAAAETEGWSPDPHTQIGTKVYAIP
ncbi:hypothetical protein [uncultured Ilyobacter sp.]|uniref:hypothetical protein n=1 Tax=uncultured Ilyobacter sp. TaxID=544433 RepID=UPI0029F47CD8|nr:hypothetical protein [uncultured Ilyobacter sp.]